LVTRVICVTVPQKGAARATPVHLGSCRSDRSSSANTDAASRRGDVAHAPKSYLVRVFEELVQGPRPRPQTISFVRMSPAPALAGPGSDQAQKRCSLSSGLPRPLAVVQSPSGLPVHFPLWLSPGPGAPWLDAKAPPAVPSANSPAKRMASIFLRVSSPVSS
jgi:hypothetical protein